MTKFETIRGGYVWINVEGVDYRIYYEEAGQGLPMLCLHTAGADSRQYRHILNDTGITDRFRVVAFDMPWHGRSLPPKHWWLTKYELSMKFYLAVIRAVWAAFEMRQPVVLGCSIGGYIVLPLAYHHADELRGIIGLESIAKSAGRYNDFLHHGAIHGGEFVASYTFGLNSPFSPEEGPRENWWIYAQGGPGVYSGDTAFGREFDVRDDLKDIDTSKCKVSILSGEYDYSALPLMSKAVADGIPGSRFVFMPKMGHFPVNEDYPSFRPYLLAELDYMLAD